MEDTCPQWQLQNMTDTQYISKNTIFNLKFWSKFFAVSVTLHEDNLCERATMIDIQMMEVFL